MTSPSDASSRCEPSVSSSVSTFGATGGTGTVSVAVARECSWRAASQAKWIAVTSTAEGQGDGSVGFRVAENADPVARQGAVTVADRSISIAQSPAPCRYEVIPSATTIGAAGGQLTVDVHGHSACAWTARSEVAWASVAPASGSGNGVVRVSVSANGGAARRVSLVIAGETISATQGAAAAPPPPPPPPAPTPPPTPPPPTPPPPEPPPPPVPPPTPPPPVPPPSPDPVPIGPIDLSGRIWNVAGHCPEITFELRDRDVYTTADTEFRKISCSKIDRGTNLEVEGMRMSDGRVRADRVTKR